MLTEDLKHNSLNENKNSKNLYIEGDNLEVLKHMLSAYNEKIKMIYIDPPYNTGTDDFTYNDSRKFTKEELSKIVKIDLTEAKRILEFTTSNSNSHSAWLTFMYPRLYLARELLMEDGVIFISIDDNEQAQLKLICDEIYGEYNFVNCFTWVNNLKGRATSTAGSTKTYESILVYAKNKDAVNEFSNKTKFLISSSKLFYNKKEYKIYEDEFGKFLIKNQLYNTNSKFNERTRKTLVFNIHYNPTTFEIKFSDIDEKKDFPGFVKIEPHKNSNGTHKFHAWRWQKSKILSEKHNLFFTSEKNDGNYNIYTKVRDIDTSRLKDIVNTGPGSSELNKILGKDLFSNPKPTSLINILISSFFYKNYDQEENIVLDFFSGSATTAHSVINLNAINKTNIKFIMIQLPEKITSKSLSAYNFCLKNNLEPSIPSIAKMRIIASGKKVISDNNLDPDIIDVGFKVYKTKDIKKTNYFDSITSFDDSQTQILALNSLEKSDLQDLLLTWKVNDGLFFNDDFSELILDNYIVHYFGEIAYLMYPNFNNKQIRLLLEELDNVENSFNVRKLVVFALNFTSKEQLELSEALKVYKNKKKIELDVIFRY